MLLTLLIPTFFCPRNNEVKVQELPRTPSAAPRSFSGSLPIIGASGQPDGTRTASLPRQPGSATSPTAPAAGRHPGGDSAPTARPAAPTPALIAPAAATVPAAPTPARDSPTGSVSDQPSGQDDAAAPGSSAGHLSVSFT
jgi:hypothetical protein